jgi:hypothetical protein
MEGDPEEGKLTADVIQLNGGEIGAISADSVQIQQGGATRVIAREVGLRRGAVGLVDADEVAMNQSWAVGVRGTQVGLDGGGAAIVTGGHVGMGNSRVGLTVAGTADLRDSSTFVLLAREVHGPVETVLDTRGTITAGLVAGMAIGMVLFVGGLLSRRRR